MSENREERREREVRDAAERREQAARKGERVEPTVKPETNLVQR